MIIDSSAWLDFFRRRDTPVAAALRGAIADPTTRLMTIAVRVGVPVLQADHDLDVLGRHTPMQIAPRP